MAVTTNSTTQVSTTTPGAGKFVGELFGVIVFLVIAVNVTMYLHKRAWWKRKLDQAWITLNNCLCRIRETLRRLFARVPDLSTLVDRTTLTAVARRPSDNRGLVDNHSPKYANLPVVNPIIYTNDRRDEQTSENIQTRDFAGRHPVDEPIYCLSTLDVNTGVPTVNPKISAPMNRHKKSNTGYYNVTAKSDIQTTKEHVSKTVGSWPGCDGSESKKEKLSLANQPLTRGLVSKRRLDFHVRVAPKHNRLKSNDKSTTRLQPGNQWRDGGVPLEGKGNKSEEIQKLETNKLKTVLKGRSASGCEKAQPAFLPPIFFPGAKTGLYAVGTVGHRHDNL